MTAPVLAALGVAAWPKKKNPFLGGARVFDADVGLDEFGELWNTLVQKAIGDELPDERYLTELTGIVQALRRGEIPRMETPGYERDGVATSGVWGDGEVGIIELKLEPGAVIRAHNHVAYCFLSLCFEGDCEYRHYNPVDGPPPASSGTSEWFHVEEVKSGVLEPGRVTTLSRTWDNIHWFQAGKHGATLIDFMTHYPDRGDGYEQFSALEVDEQYIEGERRQRKARWIGNPFK